MPLDQLPGDGEAKAQAAVPSRDRAIQLAERLEDVLDRGRRDAATRVGDEDEHLLAGLTEQGRTSPPAGVYLMALSRMWRSAIRRLAASPRTHTGAAGSDGAPAQLAPSSISPTRARRRRARGP